MSKYKNYINDFALTYSYLNYKLNKKKQMDKEHENWALFIIGYIIFAIIAIAALVFYEYYKESKENKCVIEIIK